MDYSPEMVKGSIVPIVLSLLDGRAMYGYEMVKEVNRRSGGALQWKEGTLYPALHRLEGDGLIRARWANAPGAAESGGRQRKYYQLTRKGQRERARRTEQWRSFTDAVSGILLGGAGMKTFDDLIERITAPLQVDKALQLEVAREMRTHLHDRAAAFTAEGKGEDAAAELAIQSMGDADELQQSIWAANRRRLKLRGLMRWGFRLGLVPAAIIVTLFILPPDLVQVFSLRKNLTGAPNAEHKRHRDAIVLMTVATLPIYALRGEFPDGRHDDIQSWDTFQALSEQERLLIQQPRWVEDHSAQATRLIESIEDPDLRRLYFPEYVHELSMCYEAQNVGDSRPRTWTEVSRQQVLDAMAQGKALEPDNAIYDALHAMLLFDESTERLEDQGERKFEITDQEKFTQFIKQYRQAADGRHIDDYALPRQTYRVSLMPGDSYRDYLRRQVMYIKTLLPSLGKYRHASDQVLEYARRLAEAGDVDEAAEHVRAVQQFGAKLASPDEVPLITLLVGRAIVQKGYDAEAAIHTLAGRTADAEAVQAKAGRLQQAFDQAGGRWQQRNRAADGIFGASIGIASQGSAGARAEYAVVDRAALSFIAMCLLFVLAWFALRVGMARLVYGRENMPPQVFVHPADVRRICIWAVLLPISVYGVYILSPISGRAYGLNITTERVMLEYVTVGVAIWTLLRVLSHRGVAQRAGEIGLDAPRPQMWADQTWFLRIAGVLAAAVVLYLAWWEKAVDAYVAAGNNWGSPDDLAGWGYALTGAVMLFGLAWQVRDYRWIWATAGQDMRLRREGFAKVQRVLRQSLFAALAVVLVSCVVVTFQGFLDVYLGPVFLSAAVAVLGLSLYCLGRLICLPRRPYAIVLARSAAPIIALPLIAVSVLAGLSLQQTEAKHVAQAGYIFANEIRGTSWRDLQDHLRAEHQAERSEQSRPEP